MVSRRLRPAYEKYGLNSAKPEFFGPLRLRKFAARYSRLKSAGYGTDRQTDSKEYYCEGESASGFVDIPDTSAPQRHSGDVSGGVRQCRQRNVVATQRQSARATSLLRTRHAPAARRDKRRRRKDSMWRQDVSSTSAAVLY